MWISACVSKTPISCLNPEFCFNGNVSSPRVRFPQEDMKGKQGLLFGDCASVTYPSVCQTSVGPARMLQGRGLGGESSQS